jgi:hypothetical protein
MKLRILIAVLLLGFSLFAQSGAWTVTNKLFVKIIKEVGKFDQSNTLAVLKKGDSVFVSGIGNDEIYYNAKYKSIDGLIRNFDVVENEDIYQIKLNLWNRLEEKKDSVKNILRNIYKKAFGSSIANKIINKEIWIGMTTEMCFESWGEPDDKTRTVYPQSVVEWWYYGANTLYFLNEKLQSYTEH